MSRIIIIIGSILFFFPLSSYSTHIVGGDVTYSCLGYDIDTISVNNYDTVGVNLLMEFTMYRDLFSGGAQFNTNADFGIWQSNGSGWTYFDTARNQDFVDRAEIPVEDDPCVEVTDMVGVEKAVYRFPINLPFNGRNFLVAYQRCCRNPTINNLINPGDTGAAFQIEIAAEALLLCNNSPKFNSFPPIFVCANFDIDFDHSAVDDEGDVLVYEFCAPLQAGGTDGSNGAGSGDPNGCTGVTPSPVICGPNFMEVDFAPGFTSANPMGGDPIVSISGTTGLISGSPNVLGQYVVGVCVKEFRNGVLLGEIRRDFQFNVVMCTPLVFAEIDAGIVDGATDLTYNIASCGENTVDITNTSYQESAIQSYSWWFEIAPGDTTYLNTRDVSITFPDIGEYVGRMILNEGTECADTADVVVNIFPTIETDYSFVYDTCVAGPVEFEDLTVTGADAVVAWDWDFNGINASPESDPSHLFEEPGPQLVTLTSTDSNGCTDEKEEEIIWYPVPPLLIVQPTKFLACAPGEISFVNLSEPINDDYDITWDFGDGEIGTEISPTHNYEEPGIYSVNLDIVSPIGCETSKFFPNWITIEEKPTAIFTCNPENPTIFDKEVEFTNQSIDAVRQQWNFDNEFVSLEENPTYTFQDTGIYEITLIAFHETGCPDTLRKTIDIEPLVDYFMPNAFTPNGDGKNDEFIGKGYLAGLKGFEMNIWNRWGEQVYNSEDPYRGWNGRKQNTGEMSPQGVYVWELRYIGPRGGDEALKGHVTLLR